MVLRPWGANEVLETWKVIMERRHEPVCLILTRQAIRTARTPASMGVIPKTSGGLLLNLVSRVGDRNVAMLYAADRLPMASAFGRSQGTSGSSVCI